MDKYDNNNKKINKIKLINNNNLVNSKLKENNKFNILNRTYIGGIKVKAKKTKGKIQMKSNEIILVLIIFLIIVFSPLCLSKKMPLRKINFFSEIIIWINEIDEQNILSDEYNDYLPDEVLINDNIIENNKTQFYLNDTENKIVMRWNNLITNCSYMFYLVNIIKMDLSNFNT